MQLSLAGEPAIDIEFDTAFLSTAGGQSTPVKFNDFLGWLPEITAPPATFRLEGLSPAGEATVFNGSLLMQQFTGGSFWLYDADDTLLLAGELALPWLTGNIGLADGGLFTSHFSQISGGTLAPYLQPTSVVLQMHLWNVNSGAGFSVTPAPLGAVVHTGTLNTFTASVTADLEGTEIPEPAAAVLLIAGALLAAMMAGPRRSAGR